MNFTMKIHIVDGQLQVVDFEDMTGVVTIGMALQAVEAAKAALLNIPVARPEQPMTDGAAEPPVNARDHPPA